MEAMLPDTTLSHYRIVEKLGAGGMGEVWLAEDTRLKRKVALKLLPAELTADAERVRRFEQEAQAASALNHPNIITVYDIGECEAGRFIVMEFVAGRTLRAAMAEGHSLKTLLEWGAQMAKALAAAHAAGITHRDIKPDNVMVRDDGYVKVLDFGIARLLPAQANDAEAATLALQTAPGTILGTAAYMSPEQARGESANHPADVFALGIVLYELMTGQHPFQAGTMVGYLHAITSQTPAPPRQWLPQLPAVVNELLLRMLSKEAHQRPTAEEVVQQLQEVDRPDDSATLLPRAAIKFQEDTEPLSFATLAFNHRVGRVSEREELRAAFRGVAEGRGTLLCVTGEPGIGKTTLVEEFLAELTAGRQATLARGRCSERLSGTEAYLPLLEALDGLLHADADCAALMRRFAPTWYAQTAPVSVMATAASTGFTETNEASQERMKRELVAVLQAAAQPRPLVIFFDDLHWADVSTIDALNYLASKFDALPLLIILTYRPSDMLLAQHPFLQIKPELQSRGLCRELLLEFLSEAEIAEYLALEFPGHRFPAEFAQLIHARTEGNPLFMVDLVRYLRARGVIAEADGTWSLAQATPDLERELPESVRGMIERKLAQLNEADRELLAVASVQGYEFDSAVVARVLNLAADEVEARLHKLERVFALVKLARETEFPNHELTLRYRFVHVLYQQALYAELRATRKATLSREVALTLEAFYGATKNASAGELAALFETGRAFGEAAAYFLAAAQHANQLFAAQEAAALARRGIAALQYLPESPERARQELSLQLALGLALRTSLSYSHEETGQAYARARDLSHQIDDAPQFFPILFGLWEYYQGQAQLTTALEIGTELLRLAGNDDALLVVAHNVMGDNLTFTGDFAAAREHLEKGSALYDRTRHGENAARFGYDSGVACLNFSSIVLWYLGYPDQALQNSDAACRLAAELAHPVSQVNAENSAARFHRLIGDMETAKEHAERSIELATRYDIGALAMMGKLMRAWALIGQHQSTEGIAEIGEWPTPSVFIGAGWMSGILAEGYGEAGQPEKALTVLEQALSLISQTGERFQEAELLRMKGELLLQSEAATEAESCFAQALAIARRQKAKSLELRAALSLARLWQQQGKPVEARQMLAEIYGWFTEGFDTTDLRDANALLNKLQSTN